MRSTRARSAPRKSRETGSLPSGSEQLLQMRAILLALGFQSAGRVQKQRTPLELDWHGRRLTLALDDVARLGAFLEIEIVTDEAEWQSARDALLEFALELGLATSERRSYLELVNPRPPAP
jgi:predicted adenylyl cyclase CyaB